MHNQNLSHLVSTELPDQLFPSFKPVEMKANDSSVLPPPVTAAAAAGGGASSSVEPGALAKSSSSSLKALLSSYRSSLSGAALASFVAPAFPLASLRVPAPTPPLLSRGVGRSSSHLSLVALDPESSVLQPAVLQRLKLSVIRGEARGIAGCNEERDADAMPPVAPGLRKRDSSKLASATDETDEATHKKQKKLPLVPKPSLLALDKQLSRSKSTAANTELAAFALARHLVDWAEGFNIEPDEEDDDESEAESEAAPKATAALTQSIGSLPRMPTIESGPSSEWMARGESNGGTFSYTTPDCLSSASTPAYDPPMSRCGSSASLDTLPPPDHEHNPAAADGRLHELDMLAEGDPSAFLFPSGALSPFASPHGPLAQPPLHPQVSLGLSFALASPKVSPALLAHLSSPEERASMLSGSFQLDDAYAAGGTPGEPHSAPQLAQTTTSTGARVALIQHMQPHAQMSW